MIAVSTDINTPQILSDEVFILGAAKNCTRSGRLRIGPERTRVFRTTGCRTGSSASQRVVIEGDAEEQIAARLSRICAKSFNYQGCYEQIFQCLGIQRYPSRLPELMSGAQAVGEKLTRSY